MMTIFLKDMMLLQEIWHSIILASNCYTEKRKQMEGTQNKSLVTLGLL